MNPPRRDLPAPQHSATLNRLVGIEEPLVHQADITSRLEYEQQRLARRRAAADRSRRRRAEAA